MENDKESVLLWEKYKDKTREDAATRNEVSSGDRMFTGRTEGIAALRPITTSSALPPPPRPAASFPCLPLNTSTGHRKLQECPFYKLSLKNSYVLVDSTFVVWVHSIIQFCCYMMVLRKPVFYR